MPLYRQFRTQEEIDHEYNLRARTPDAEALLAGYAERSARARATMRCDLDIRFGPTLDETLDIFPAEKPGAPILVFIHGGYWRALSSKEFSFIAQGFVPHGITVFITNYSLCPKVGIPEITRQSRAAIAWVFANAARFNGDAERIWVMGHSAGGQQTAMVLGTDWPGEYGLRNDLVKGGIAISGVYDLEPLLYSYLQPVLRLDHELIRRESPCRNIPATAPPLRLYVGEREPAEFQRQMQDYLSAWRAARLTGEGSVRSGEDHFTILHDLAEPGGAFCAEMLQFIGLTVKTT